MALCVIRRTGTFSGSSVNIFFIVFLRPNYVYAYIHIESLVFSIDWSLEGNIQSSNQYFSAFLTEHTAYKWLNLFSLFVFIIEFSLIVIGTKFRFPLRELIKKNRSRGVGGYWHWVMRFVACASRSQ